MRVAIVGIQGSGKSTQAELMGENLKIPVISLGGILRTGINNDDPFVTDWYTRKDINNGLMAPDHLVKKVLDRESNRLDSFILEGFPRTVEQAHFLLNTICIDKVIEIIISEECAFNRLQLRGRSDDSREGIHNRFTAYLEKIDPIREYLIKKETYFAVDGIGTETDVTELIRHTL